MKTTIARYRRSGRSRGRAFDSREEAGEEVGRSRRGCAPCATRNDWQELRQTRGRTLPAQDDVGRGDDEISHVRFHALPRDSSPPSRGAYLREASVSPFRIFRFSHPARSRRDDFARACRKRGFVDRKYPGSPTGPRSRLRKTPVRFFNSAIIDYQ